MLLNNFRLMMAASSKAYVYPKHILFFLVVHKWYEQRAHTKKNFFPHLLHLDIR